MTPGASQSVVVAPSPLFRRTRSPLVSKRPRRFGRQALLGESEPTNFNLRLIKLLFHPVDANSPVGRLHPPGGTEREKGRLRGDLVSV